MRAKKKAKTGKASAMATQHADDSSHGVLLHKGGKQQPPALSNARDDDDSIMQVVEKRIADKERNIRALKRSMNRQAQLTNTHPATTQTPSSRLPGQMQMPTSTTRVTILSGGPESLPAAAMFLAHNRIVTIYAENKFRRSLLLKALEDLRNSCLKSSLGKTFFLKSKERHLQEAVISADLLLDQSTGPEKQLYIMWEFVVRHAKPSAILWTEGCVQPAENIAKIVSGKVEKHKRSRANDILEVRFAVPAHTYRGVEFFAATEASSATVQATIAELNALQRKPILVQTAQKVSVLDRLDSALIREASKLVKEGHATLAAIDEVVRGWLAPKLLLGGVFERLHRQSEIGLQGFFGGLNLNRSRLWQASDEVADPSLSDWQQMARTAADQYDLPGPAADRQRADRNQLEQALVELLSEHGHQGGIITDSRFSSCIAAVVQDEARIDKSLMIIDHVGDTTNKVAPQPPILPPEAVTSQHITTAEAPTLTTSKNTDSSCPTNVVGADKTMNTQNVIAGARFIAETPNLARGQAGPAAPAEKSLPHKSTINGVKNMTSPSDPNRTAPIKPRPASTVTSPAVPDRPRFPDVIRSSVPPAPTTGLLRPAPGPDLKATGHTIDSFPRAHHAMLAARDLRNELLPRKDTSNHTLRPHNGNLSSSGYPTGPSSHGQRPSSPRGNRQSSNLQGGYRGGSRGSYRGGYRDRGDYHSRGEYHDRGDFHGRGDHHGSGRHQGSTSYYEDRDSYSRNQDHLHGSSEDYGNRDRQKLVSGPDGQWTWTPTPAPTAPAPFTAPTSIQHQGDRQALPVPPPFVPPPFVVPPFLMPPHLPPPGLVPQGPGGNAPFAHAPGLPSKPASTAVPVQTLIQHGGRRQFSDSPHHPKFSEWWDTFDEGPVGKPA